MNTLLFRALVLSQLVLYTVLYFFIPRYRKVEIPFLGKMISIPDFASFYSSYIEIFVNQIYYFSKETNKKHVIIDAGANVGVSVIYFKFKYPNSKVIAIEADPFVFRFLKENLNEFGIRDGIILINKALWSKNKLRIPFYSEGADGGRAVKKLASMKPIYVDTITFNNLWNDKVDFLKIDIEGVEYKVLSNQKNILKSTDKAFVEYHSFTGSRQNLSDLLNIIRESGLRVRMIETMSNRKMPFIKKVNNLDMDLQLNIFLTR